MQAAPSCCRGAVLVCHMHCRPGPTLAAPLSQLRTLTSSSRESLAKKVRVSLSDCIAAQLFVAITVAAEHDLPDFKLMLFVPYPLSSCLPLMTRKYSVSRYSRLPSQEDPRRYYCLPYPASAIGVKCRDIRHWLMSNVPLENSRHYALPDVWL